MATGVLLSLLTGKTELVVRACLWCWQDAVHCPPCGLLCPQGAPRLLCISGEHYHHCHGYLCQPHPAAGEDEAYPVAIRLLSGPQSRTSASTPLDARDSDRNHTIWNARIVLATTGLHLAQFGTSIGLWPKLLTMLSSSSMTRHSKRLPSAISPSWGPCLASVSSCALEILVKPLVAQGRGGLPRRCELCLMSLP